MHKLVLAVLGGLSCFLALAGVPAETTPEEILGEIRATTLDVERAVPVRGVTIDLEFGSLELDSGHLFPATTIAGRTLEFVFLGDGRLLVEPPDDVEAGQLEIFAGESPLEARIDSAVLVVGDERIGSRLLTRPAEPAPDEKQTVVATELLEAWVASPERKGFGADAAILKAVSGDAAFQRYFAALLTSEEHGRFYYILDPSDLEQVTLGQFVACEMDDREEYQAERELRRAKKEGRFIQTRLEDLGDFDTWMRSSIRGTDARPLPGSAGFEPRHYVLDATIDTRELKIQGRATIDLESSEDGRRGIVFDLHPDLKPTSVVDAKGTELAWFRSGGALHVLLGEPSAAGQTVQIVVEYAGVCLERLEKGILLLRDTYSWYPRTGEFDRATYDATLRWPKSVNLLGSGQVVDSGVEEGLRFERRLLEVPSAAFSFEVGDFKIIQEQIGHVELTLGVSKSTLPEDTDARTEILETLEGAMTFYEENFGPYPLDYMTVATQPRDFSQGFLGFLTLSHYLLAAPWGSEFGEDDLHERSVTRRETVAHEVAHQWWGHKVGWYNYRDQWLSEALAEYSAVLYMASQSDRRSVYLTRHAGNWKSSLSDIADDGREVESLGPVVLGERLMSSHSEWGYFAIVYDKGYLVFSMLARLLGEEALVKMLGHLATAVGNRAIDTEVFLKSIERMSGADLSQFAERFVYGTGIPEVYYRYAFEENPEGGWQIRGQARPAGTAIYKYSLERTEGGTWDVERHHTGNRDVSNFAVVVPFQIVVEGRDPGATMKHKVMSEYSTARGYGGSMVLQGEGSDFLIPVKEEPAQFWLDQQGEVLAHFYSEQREPKRVLRYKAMELAAEEAELVLREALSAPLMSDDVQKELDWSDKELQRRSEVEDGRIHLELARLYLDQNREGASRESLEIAEKILRGRFRGFYSGIREAIACRLAIRAGDYSTAFNALKGKLWLDVPRDDGIDSDFVRRRWQEGDIGDGEDYALLAVSAHETGRPLIAKLAAAEASQQGADMAPLTALFDE